MYEILVGEKKCNNNLQFLTGEIGNYRHLFYSFRIIIWGLDTNMGKYYPQFTQAL